MHSITFTCETITPMFLSGADGSTPELRPPSIKGALRFWWRALNGHLSLEDLKRREGEIFGSTDRRSKVVIQVKKKLVFDSSSVGQAAMLPHKYKEKEQSWQNCFKDGQEFSIKLRMPEHLAEEIKNTFVLTCLLGGLGKRSRRGFGSVQIKEINDKPYQMPSSLKDIYGLLLSEYYQVDENEQIITSHNSSRVEYPWIKKIELGVKVEDILSKIINSSHEIKKSDFEQAKNEERYIVNSRTGKLICNKKTGKPILETYFEAAIGDGRDRLASPIYVSVLADKKTPVITTLNHVPPKGRSKKEHSKLQKELIQKLK